LGNFYEVNARIQTESLFTSLQVTIIHLGLLNHHSLRSW